MNPDQNNQPQVPQASNGIYDEYGRPLQTAVPQRGAAPQPQPEQPLPATSVSESQQSPTAQPVQSQMPPQVVYMSRPLEPVQPHISDEARARHEKSKAEYPQLNLSEGEYVISDIHRHPIGLLQIWGITGLLILLLIVGIIVIMSGAGESADLVTTNVSALAFMMLMVCVLVFLGGVIATVVYQANRFFLTNESVTQHIQTTLFAKKEQTISLGNIEDASFRKVGILQHLLDYGSLRLSTEGDETTYRFNYVGDPERQIALLNNAVESFKNGRPVDTDES